MPYTESHAPWFTCANRMNPLGLAHWSLMMRSYWRGKAHDQGGVPTLEGGPASRLHLMYLRARLEGLEPPTNGFEVRSGELTALPGESRFVTLRGVTVSPTSPNVPTRPDNHGQFAALVLQGFSGKLVSPREAAALLGVNRETIYRLCAKSELPHVRVGSVLRVDLAAHLARS